MQTTWGQLYIYILIVGWYSCVNFNSKGTKICPGCPTRVPYRYNVLGTFQVTDSWSERVKGKTLCRVRLEMLDLKTPSWWGVKGSPPMKMPKIAERPLVQSCPTCRTSSKQRYAPGWMCDNEKCSSFSKSNGQAFTEPPAYHPAFLNERHKWPRHIKAGSTYRPNEQPRNVDIPLSMEGDGLPPVRGLQLKD